MFTASCKLIAIDCFFIESKQLKITTPHNHPPDMNLVRKLQLRKKCLDAAASSSHQLLHVFHEATRGEEGAELLGYGTMYRTMQRERRKNQPPAPVDADEAHEFLVSPKYNAQNFAKYYKGLVRGEEDGEPKDGERAMTFAHEGKKFYYCQLVDNFNTTLDILLGNLARLGPDTKIIFADGTFKTSPALRDNKHMYQLLRIYAEHMGYVFPIFQAVMSCKTKSLYDAVYARLKELLPSTVEPDLVMADYETALQSGLGEIFPTAQVLGCWFHFSQVRIKC